jgi:hypothetical protein
LPDLWQSEAVQVSEVWPTGENDASQGCLIHKKGDLPSCSGRFVPHINYVDGNGLYRGKENTPAELKFKVFKFSNRKRPDDINKRLIVSVFSEFGCESLAVNYCLPFLFNTQPQYYRIAVSWYGREYLYRHLVDEFWELEEPHQWLREYSRAFAHESKTMDKIERALSQQGVFLPAAVLGNFCVGYFCTQCKIYWGDPTNSAKVCQQCKSPHLVHSMFSRVPEFRPHITPVPRPGPEAMKKVAHMVKPNMVGIFARRRVSYGRNLSADFYADLIRRLESMGYNVIWLGEKQSTLPCPLPHVTDFSRMPESRDLELTLSIISQCKFTVQLWTASTRFAAMMGVPYLIVETPDQIAGPPGQEGIRLALLTKSYKHKKMVYSHFRCFEDDTPGGLAAIERGIREMEAGNFKDVIGPVENEYNVIKKMSQCKVWDSMEDR